MHHIKSELNKLLGQIERLDEFSMESASQFYDLFERAYNIISDSFDLDQCHSILHHLRSQMRDLDRLRTSSSISRKKENTSNRRQTGRPESVQQNNNEKNSLSEMKQRSVNELRIFISHL